jgi:hypothetical protein
MDVAPLLLADHGDLLSALPFFAPALALPIGILVLIVRDRVRRRRRESGER